MRLDYFLKLTCKIMTSSVITWYYTFYAWPNL